MAHKDTKQEAQAEWDKWQELQTQIKDLEYLRAQDDEFLERYQARLSELHEEADAAGMRFEILLRKMPKRTNWI